jgi:hypothetical protein
MLGRVLFGLDLAFGGRDAQLLDFILRPLLERIPVLQPLQVVHCICQRLGQVA